MKKLLVLIFALVSLAVVAQNPVNTKYVNGFPSTAYSLTVPSDVQYYSLYGSKTLSAPYTIGVTGTPVNGSCIVLAYDGSSITTNNNAVTVFGVALSGTPDPAGLSGWLSAAQGKYLFVAVYKSVAWEVNYFRTSGSTHWIGKSDIGAIGNDTTIQSLATGLRIKPLSVTSAHISTSAAIPYSKLSLTGSLLNADVATGASIALSKLAPLTASKALVSDGSGVVATSAATATELGYVSGVTSAIQTQLGTKITAGAGAIVNADINASAAIALSKLATVTASRALVSDGSGNVTTSTVTATELSYVSGATSNIQAHLAALDTSSAVLTHTSISSSGTVITSLKENTIINSTGGGVTVTLPLASSVASGKYIEFFMVGANLSKIITAGSDKIINVYNASVTTDTLLVTKRGVMMYSDGSANWIVGRKY